MRAGNATTAHEGASRRRKARRDPGGLVVPQPRPGGLKLAVHSIERVVDHAVMPCAVPRLDERLDPGEQVGARPLLWGEALCAERTHFAIEPVDIDGLRPVVLDQDPPANDNGSDVSAYRTFDEGLGDVEFRVDPGSARPPVEIDGDRSPLHAGKGGAAPASKPA